MKYIKNLKKFDIFIIISLFITSFTPLFFFKIAYSKDFKEKFVTIRVNGVTKEEINLKDNKTLHINTTHGENKIIISNGKVSMIDADCTDKLCVNSKPISNVYETIVCLPHKVIIEIKGETEKSFDDMIFSH
ncbi:MAG: NusG domain II-containing protein [Clostridium sp.]